MRQLAAGAFRKRLRLISSAHRHRSGNRPRTRAGQSAAYHSHHQHHRVGPDLDHRLRHPQTGIPGISLPMAQQDNGLPFGIHAQAKQANDGLLLQLAAQVERALHGRWNDGRRPAIHVTRMPP